MFNKYLTLKECQDFFSTKKEWSAKDFASRKRFNFFARGYVHFINTNSPHTKSCLNRARRTKGSVIRARYLDERSKLTDEEILGVINNTCIYSRKKYNPHQAKYIAASREQKEAARSYCQMLEEEFKEMKIIKASLLKDLSEKYRTIIYDMYRKLPNFSAVQTYIRNIKIIYDPHLFNPQGMKIRLIHDFRNAAKHTTEERITQLKEERDYNEKQIFHATRTGQGVNFSRIRQIIQRGGLEITKYAKKIAEETRVLLNKFPKLMRKIGITTKVDFFNAANYLLKFFFNDKYRRSRLKYVRNRFRLPLSK